MGRTAVCILCPEAVNFSVITECPQGPLYPQKNTLDDIILTGPGKQEMVSIVDTLGGQMHAMKIQALQH